VFFDDEMVMPLAIQITAKMVWRTLSEPVGPPDHNQ
jgi:hypothetical protein